MLMRRPAGKRSGCPRSRSRRARVSARAASASGTCPTTWTCDASTTRNKTVPAETLAPVVALRRAITPSRRPNKEGSRPPRRRLARRCIAPGWSAAKRALACSQPNEPRAASRGQHQRSSSVPPVRGLALPARTALPLAPGRAAEGRPARKAGQEPRELLTTRHVRSKRHSTTRVSRPSMGATTSAAPPGRASSRAGTRMDSRTACSFTTAVPKSRLHCCSLRKLIPGASSPAPVAACRFSVRKHVDFLHGARR